MVILIPEKSGKEYHHFMSEKKKIDWENLQPQEKLKYEIAEELGLLEKVRTEGWKALSSRETGRIGGLMTRKKMEEKRRVGAHGESECHIE